MKDKEILNEVYSKCRKAMDEARFEGQHNHTAKLISSFIEQEWQRADEELGIGWGDHPLTKWDEGQTYNMNEQDVNENSAGGGTHGHFSQSWYKKNERHRGLEIGEDGTVKGLTDE